MAQTYKYTIVGDTQPAVKGNEALDASIKQVDTSSKQLESSLAKSGEALELSLQKQDAKIKAIGGSINILGGSVELVVGSLGLIGIDEKTIGEFQKAAVSAIAFADGAKRVFEGYKEITEAKKLFSAITKAETVAEAANTTATVANTTATVAGTAATNTANTATKALNATILKNPYVIAAAAVAALAAGIYLLVKANSDEAKSLEEVNAAFEKRNNRYQEAIGLRNREAEIQIQSVEREEGAIAAAEKRITLYEDLAVQARYAEQIADEQTAGAIIAQEKLVKSLETELTRRQGLSDEKRKLNDLGGDEIKLAETIQLAKEKLFDLEKIYSKALLDSKQAEENLAQARLKLEEEQTKKREENIRKAKEAREKADKAAEALAIRAVKQLKDEREAIEALADLYAQEYPDEGRTGFIKFNNDLDRTNFLLKEQLDVLFSLNTEYEDLSEELRNTQDELNAIGNGLGDTFFSEELGETFFGGVLGESFFSEDQLAVFKKLRDAQKTGLQLQLEDLENTYRSDLSLFTDNEEMKSQITEQYEKDRAKTVRQYAIQNAQAVLGITSQFLNTIAQVNQASLELQLAQAAGNQAAIDQINADALEQQKKLRIAQVYVTTAESILNGFNATSTLPPPFNFIAGAALAAAYGALGFKTVQTINATTLEGGGGTGTGFNNIPGGASFSLPGGAGVPAGLPGGGVLPGLGGGRLGTPSIGTVAEPLRAYVLAGDVSNGVQANIALNNRRRLAG